MGCICKNFYLKISRQYAFIYLVNLIPVSGLFKLFKTDGFKLKWNIYEKGGLKKIIMSQNLLVFAKSYKTELRNIWKKIRSYLLLAKWLMLSKTSLKHPNWKTGSWPRDKVFKLIISYMFHLPWLRSRYFARVLVNNTIWNA